MPEAITVHCPGCETAFPVDPAKVPPQGVRARCSICQEIFPVDAVQPEEPTAGVGVAEPGEPTASEEPTAGVGEAEPAAEEEAVAEAEGDFGGLDVSEQPGTDEAGDAEAAVEDDPDFGGFDTEIELDTSDDTFGDVTDDFETTVEEPPAEAPPEEGEEGTDTVEEVEAEEAAEPAGTEPELGVGEAAEESTAAAAEATPRPTFGQRSPEQKAERLARVLVSDMISYNPELYEKAVEQGTLKEDFEEEIQKSWEEYVEQVGEDLATSTSYWIDALNGILAKGDNVFDEDWRPGAGEH